jgi:hypothetical protein
MERSAITGSRHPPTTKSRSDDIIGIIVQKSLSSFSPNSTFDNVVAARLWLLVTIVRRLRYATPPVMHHVVAARLGKNKNESETDISKQKK